MPIVVATDYAHVTGGAGKIALGSAKGLADRGHEVVLFTGIGPIADELVACHSLRHECLEQASVWDDANVAGAAVRGLWNLSAYRRMRRLLASMDRSQTVLHLHSWTKALSSSVVQAAVVSGVPVVVTLHDYFTVCPTGTLFNHRTGAHCQLRPMSAACVASNCDARRYAHKLWRVARHAVQGSIAGLPGLVRDLIVVSEANRRQFERLLPDGARLHHVPNFAEVPRAPQVPVGSNRAIAYVGRLSAEKGPLLLADCAERLKVPVVFIGEGPQAAAVKQRCPSAEITGWLSPEQVRQCLRQNARALAFPSLWYETQGLVVAEAAALGIPAIVSDSTGARDFVDDGISGMWFRNGDGDDLCEKMRALTADPMLAERLGQAAYTRFWASPPTLDHHLDGLERVYEGVLARHAGGRQKRVPQPHSITPSEGTR